MFRSLRDKLRLFTDKAGKELEEAEEGVKEDQESEVEVEEEEKIEV